MLYVNVSPLSTSFPIGVKLYDPSTNTNVAGVPLIVGASFVLVTSILNAFSVSLATPSLTLILILEYITP